MAFLNGRVTFVRYRVLGDKPLPFGEEHLERLEAHAIGQHGAAETEDGVNFGWAGGDHVLDTGFDLAKNVINDTLHAAIRIDTDKIPSSLLQAYTKIELIARAANNPSGFPTKTQRVEAKEAAEARAESEASDGRFKKLKHYPVLWDGLSNALYIGATSANVVERLVSLFRDTFGRELEPVTAGSLATWMADARDRTEALEQVAPSGFVSAEAQPSIAWADGDPLLRDFLGNEFLLWLWHTLQNDGDTLILPDGSEASVMFSKTLTLDCPTGQTGRDTLSDEGPARMPEAIRALQAGKLPRKAGLIVVRHDMQYELTLQAETLAVSALNLPKLEGVSGHELLITRVDSLRHFVETLDLLYDAYLQRRLGPWTDEVGRIRNWLSAA